MKTVFNVLLVCLCAFSQLAVRADGFPSDFSEPPGMPKHQEKSKWYVGAGVGNLVSAGMPMSKEEKWVSESSYYSDKSRSEENSRVGKEVVLGYQLNKTVAFELGYLREDKGFTATSTATMQTYDWWTDNVASIPVSITQTTKLTAWHISLVGQKPLNENVSLTGSVGVIRVYTDWEQRQTYAWPGGDGSSQVWNSSTRNDDFMFSVGLNAKVAEKTDMRFQLRKSSAMPSVMPTLTFIYHL